MTFKEFLKTKNGKGGILLSIASLGVMLMIIQTYGFYEFSGDGDNDSSYRSDGQEYIVFPYYFTFISNVFAIVVPIIVLKRNKEVDSKMVKHLKVMMAVNLTITMIVFGTILIGVIEGDEPLYVIQTFCVHMITPVASIAVFIGDAKTRSDKEIDKHKIVAINIIMPIAGLLLALMMYIIFGEVTDNGYGKEDVPYTFLDMANEDGYNPVLYIGVIGVAYIGFSYMYSQMYAKLKSNQVSI